MKIKEFKFIHINDLEISEHHIRKTFRDRDLEELKLSIWKIGILDPLSVVYDDKTKKYKIFKGARRYLAALKLRDEGKLLGGNSRGYFSIPCYVMEGTVKEQIEESLLDELMRTAVDSLDTKKSIEKLIEHYGDINKAAMALGVSPRILDDFLCLQEPKKKVSRINE